MTVAGMFRFYFNRHGAAPLVWCVSPVEGGWELAVSEVRTRVPAASVYRTKAEKDEDDGRPSGWFEARGVLHVVGSIATIDAPMVPA